MLEELLGAVRNTYPRLPQCEELEDETPFNP